MQVDIIKVAEIISALTVISGAFFTIFKIINCSKELKEKNENQDQEIKKIKDEQKLLMQAQLACLDGLRQLGANGPVTNMIEKMEQHMIDAAHD